MEIDLLKIYNINKEMDKKQELINKRKELNNLISAIVCGDSEFSSTDKKIFNELKIKYKKVSKEHFNYGGFGYRPKIETKYEYVIQLSKSNVETIQKYLKNLSSELTK